MEQCWRVMHSTVESIYSHGGRNAEDGGESVQEWHGEGHHGVVRHMYNVRFAIIRAETWEYLQNLTYRDEEMPTQIVKIPTCWYASQGKNQNILWFPVHYTLQYTNYFKTWVYVCMIGKAMVSHQIYMGLCAVTMQASIVLEIRIRFSLFFF